MLGSEKLRNGKMVVFNRKRKYSKAFGKAANYVGAALRVRKMFRGSGSYTKNRKRVIYGGGVSTQNDVSYQYRKKSMPKYKRRAWKNFSKKVQAVIGSSLGSKSVVVNSTGNFKAAPLAQEFGSFVLCGRGGEDKFGDVGNRDLEDIASSVGIAGQLMLKSAILDCTFTNISANKAKLEVDIYHVRYGNEGYAKNLSAIYSQAYTNTNSLTLTTQTGTTGSTLVMSSRGATPFNFPMAISLCGMKILKKTKYFIPNGDTITYQIRDPRNYSYKRQNVEAGVGVDDGFVQPYKTQGLLVVIKTVAGSLETANLAYGVTRSYTFAQQDSSTAAKIALSRNDVAP